ncbi:MAG: hypothetical protein AB7F75_09960 [Planctomycetota bacterium]
MIIITKIVYVVKKVAGLNTLDDDMRNMHQQWTQQGGGLLGKVIKAISNMMDSLQSALQSLGSTLTGTASIPATGVTAGLGNALLPKTFATLTATLGPLGMTMLKASGIMAVFVAGSQVAISTAVVVVDRTNQARAVITDTLRNPLNIDKALNPAYHGKRDELASVGSQAMTASYLAAKYGSDYKQKPFIGYGSDTLPEQRYTLPSDLDALELDRRRQFLLDQALRDRQAANDYQMQRDRRLFEKDIGQFFVGSIIVQTPLISESGPHGVEFAETRYREIDTLVTTITSDVAHLTVIEYVNTINGKGTEAYTENIKEIIYGDTTVRYIFSIFDGTTNVGPKTYVNTISDDNRTRVVLRAADQYIEKITGARGPRLTGANPNSSPASAARVSGFRR